MTVHIAFCRDIVLTSNGSGTDCDQNLGSEVCLASRLTNAEPNSSPSCWAIEREGDR